jgi:acyl-CoA synthetase (AMP-forming)/AMP-acid ligase II
MSRVATLDTAPPAPAPVSAGPEPFNAAEWLVTRHAAATPGRRAITAIDLDGSVRTFSYAELDKAVRRFAAAPGRLGRPPGGAAAAVHG